jgi:hypothetical protein
MTLVEDADRRPFLLLGPISAAAYAHQFRIYFLPASPLLVVIPVA